MSNARTLTKMLAANGVERSGPGAIYLVTLDGNSAQCFTEPALDGWWENLTPDRKAEIFERDLDGDPAELRLHETIGRFSLTDVVDRINRVSDSFTKAIERPYVRPATQVLGEVDERPEAAGALGRLAELPARRTLPDTRPLRLDVARVHGAPAAPAGVAVAHVNEGVLPASRHSESLRPSPVDAVEVRRG